MGKQIARLDGLEIEQDAGFQRREWRVQQFGNGLFGVLLVAAILGCFGKGWLADAAAGAAGFSVEYERIIRWETPTQLRVHITDGSPGSDTVRVWFDAGYLARMRVTEVTPGPRWVSADSRRVTYALDLREPDASAIFHVTPTGPGRLSGRCGVADGASVELKQIVLP